MLYFFALVFVAVVVSLVGAVFYMLEERPTSRFSKLLDDHQQIGGPILGALITVMAAGLAFISVQMQLQAQWRQVHVSELTYWQQKLDASDTATRGLKLVKDTVAKCVEIFSKIDSSSPNPYYDRVLALQQTGILDFGNFPPTGTSLVNFDFSYQLGIIRTHFSTGRGDPSKIPSIEPQLKEVFAHVKTISEGIDSEIAKQETDAKRASAALKKLDDSG